MATNSEKLTWWQKIGYGLGDIFGGGSGTLIGFYYLYFLTDVVRLHPGLAGTVILISKVYDSITDPFEGIIADRTRTRLGRRRPYLLFGIPFVFLSFFLLFYPSNASSEMLRFGMVVLTYLFFSTVVSLVMLNYNALHAELTLDYNERTSLSSVRIFFSTVSSILCALLPLEIVKQFADVRQGYIVMGLIFGAFFALPFIATVMATRERKEFQRPPGRFDWRIFLEPFRVRTFVYFADDVSAGFCRHRCGLQRDRLLHEVLPAARGRGQLRQRGAADRAGGGAAVLRDAQQAHRETPRLYGRRGHLGRDDAGQPADYPLQPGFCHLRLCQPGRVWHRRESW